MDAPCSASLNCGTEAQLNFKLIWQLCSNHDEGLLVMHEDPEASPWCSKSCSLSVLCGCITHNCLTPSRHGHSVGLDLSSITHHTLILVRCMWVYMCMWWFFFGCSPQCAFPCIWQDMGIISEIHQRICVTPSYFLSSRLRFWYYTLIFLALLLSAVGRKKKRLSTPLSCRTHLWLYWFSLKLYLQKTGRM